MDLRIGATYVNNSAAPDRRPLKPRFSPVQQQGRIKRETDRGTIEFLHSNFANELEINTAVVGDSILNGICINNCVVYSLPGGVIADFHELLPTLQSYRNIIFCAGGNNLSHFGNPGETPRAVLAQLTNFVTALRALPRNPNVIVCTVLKRLYVTHDRIQSYSSLIAGQRDIRFFKLHQEVCRPKCFNDDGIHLSHKGKTTMATALKKLIRENNLI